MICASGIMPNGGTLSIRCASYFFLTYLLVSPPVAQLDTLLYQLHTLSFFLSPSIWPYACRLISQLHASTPRELDSNRSLLFFFNLILLFNTGSIWSHATQEAAEDKAVVLDFVGLGTTHSFITFGHLGINIPS